MTQTLDDERAARDSIRVAVRRQGARLTRAAPTGIIATLVAAACMPMVWPLLGKGVVPESVEAFVALLGSVGGGYLSDFVKGLIDRLRQQGDGRASQDEFQQALERDLDACLVADDERAAGLRVEMALLLQRVHGVEAALESASGDVQVALSNAFAELGGHFVEFRWMLGETHDAVAAIQQEQARQGVVLRHQTDLAREQLTKTNEVLQRLEPSTAPPPTLAPEPEEDPSPAPGPCPYKGLETFQPEDAEWFFGREELVAQLAARLSETPFLAVLGPSGSGKSSVLRAGLLPAVWRGLLPEASTWTTVTLTPGVHPLEELALRISLVRGVAPGSLLADLQASPSHLRLAVRQALLDAPSGARMLLMVDQFEETFTLCHDDVERRRFIDALIDLADDPDRSAKVVLAIRADFYARCAEYPALVSALQDNQALVGPMSTANLRRAIEGPAARAGIALEPGLVETVLDDLGAEPGSLPLLSHALFETWERRRGHTLTLAGYQDAGGVRHAIAQTAETVYATLDPAQQAIAKDVFLRLTALGEGTEDTRRRARRAELLDGRDTETVELVLNRLAEARLVTLDEDSVEVAHEALIRGWPKLRGWIDEDRELLRAHRRLTEVASEWDANGREEGFLYRGARLAAWQDRPLEPLNELERAFLAASREREGRERVAKRRRVRLAVIGLSVALVIISALALQAADQGELAFSRELAASARTQLSIDPELSLLLAREAFKVRPTTEAESVLRQATLDSRIRATLIGHEGPVHGVAFSPDGHRLASASADQTVRIWDPAGRAKPIVLRGHQRIVRGVALSFDGQRMASVGDDGTVRIWDSASGAELAVLRGHQGPVQGVAFSPDGQQVASAGRDGTVRIWDPVGGTQLAVLHGHQGIVYSVVFSPDGQRVAGGGEGGTVRIWQLAGGGEPVVLPADYSLVLDVAFSPDGRRVASAGFDSTVRIWDLAGGAEPVVLEGHVGAVYGVAFSLDGQHVASAGIDGTVRIWDLMGGAEAAVLRGHDGQVFDVAFSPDGQHVASASDDGTVRIWDLMGGAEAAVLRGHDGQVFDVAFSPDGQHVASASDDGTVRVWNLAAGANPVVVVLRGHGDLVSGVAFSPDGQQVASVGRDGTVRVWDWAAGANRVVLRGHDGQPWDVAFSPDGQHVASAGLDGTVRIWDLTGGAEAAVLRGHDGQVLDVAFSPDGRWVGSAGFDSTVRIWDLMGGAEAAVLRGHDGPADGVAFSPNGQQVVSAGRDWTLRVWDLRGEARPLILRGHDGPVFGVAFSPDGQRVASAGFDGTVRIWRPLAGGSEPVVLGRHTRAVLGAAFSPDGRRVASAGNDGTVRVWNCEVCGPIEQVLALAKERSKRELTAEERQTFLHEPARS